MGAPVRLQKAVPGSKENAAVERREVNALRHWACAARRLRCYPRLSALRSLTFGGSLLHPLMRENNHGAPRARPTGAAKLCPFARRLLRHRPDRGTAQEESPGGIDDTAVAPL